MAGRLSGKLVDQRAEIMEHSGLLGALQSGEGQCLLGFCTDIRQVPARVQTFFEGKRTEGRTFPGRGPVSFAMPAPFLSGGKCEENYWDSVSGLELEGRETDLRFMTVAFSRQLIGVTFGEREASFGSSSIGRGFLERTGNPRTGKPNHYQSSRARN